MRGERKSLFLVALFILFLFTGMVVVPSFQAIEFHEGEIDWEQGVITVEGFGAPPEDKTGAQARLMAQRAARVDAYRNAAEYIEGIRVNSTTTVRDYVVESDVIQTQVSGFIRGGVFVEIEYSVDDACRAVLQLPIEGQDGLTSFFERSAREDAPTLPVAEREQYEPPEEPEREPADHTGIVVDARGLNVEPALYPQIFDTDGYLLYGPTVVEVDNPELRSLVAYSRSSEKAMEMERLGDNPLLLEASDVVRREGEAPTDLILDSNQARQFLEQDQATGLIDRRAVVVIID